MCSITHTKDRKKLLGSKICNNMLLKQVDSIIINMYRVVLTDYTFILGHIIPNLLNKKVSPKFAN